MGKVHQVALVFTPDFHEDLRELCKGAHVWILDTPTNKAVAQSIWSEDMEESLFKGITTFRTQAEWSVEFLFRFMVDMLEQHHGIGRADPPCSNMAVYGMPRTRSTDQILAEYQYGKVSGRDGYFVAYRDVNTQSR